jgi:hypothetical protein
MSHPAPPVPADPGSWVNKPQPGSLGGAPTAPPVPKHPVSELATFCYACGALTPRSGPYCASCGIFWYRAFVGFCPASFEQERRRNTDVDPEELFELGDLTWVHLESATSAKGVGQRVTSAEGAAFCEFCASKHLWSWTHEHVRIIDSKGASLAIPLAHVRSQA